MAQDTLHNPSTPVQLYPGLGLPKRSTYPTDRPFCPIGAHGSCHESLSELVSVRELAMMDVMEKLTDKVNWHKKVFDEEVVSKWRKEALAIPDDYFWGLSFSAKKQEWLDDDGPPVHKPGELMERKLENIMDEATFQSCIEELRSKAKYFESTGIIPTLEASATVAKSDTLVPAELHESLRLAFDKLKADHAACPDWHPNSNDMVQDLVHPSMYPLVYGRSRGFQAERVGVTDAIKNWAGKGDIIPKLEHDSAEALSTVSLVQFDNRIQPQYWSDTYQWLPANVALHEDGTVKFTSYVNNLHPTKYPDIYRTIEKLIEISLPMWDQCLTIEDHRGERSGAGRLEPRLDRPKNASDEQPHNWIPDDIYAFEDADVDVSELVERGFDEEYYVDKPEEKREDLARFKWEKYRKPKIPAIPFKEVDYTPKPGKRLAERFAASGLQVIVKMASIELTPDKPEFPVGSWHVEGQMNECICATALYYLDSDNITDTSLSFRMQTHHDLEGEDAYYVRQDSFSWLEQIHGTVLGHGKEDSPCLQNYGSVQTRQGRLLAFPNVFQHRVSSFKLADPTKPGHRRFIALWLVDPNKRIISTANIPPQQMNWYAEEVFGSDTSIRQAALEKLPPDLIELLAQAGVPGVTTDRDCHLPQELRDFVRDYMNEDNVALPMSMEEANEHRLKLMKERSGFVKKIEEAQSWFRYNFCEH